MRTKAEEFLQQNPHGLVPVGVDELGTLWESNTICRYLAAKYDRQDLLPYEPFQRALVECWMDLASAELNPARSYAFMALVRRDPLYTDRGQIYCSAATGTA
jgi:glutathione S-transferase